MAQDPSMEEEFHSTANDIAVSFKSFINSKLIVLFIFYDL